MRHLLLGLLLLAGCETQSAYEAESARFWAERDARELQKQQEYQRIWKIRKESFPKLQIGMTLQEVVAIWGKAHAAPQSMIGHTHIGSLLYYWHGDTNQTTYPVETYELVLVNGKLAEYHVR